MFHSGPAWAKTIGPLVQAGYRVIAVDRRGYGRSTAGDTNQISVSLQARDVATTLELREVEASHVAGVSYGALVALELALARPERVLSLTLIEPTIFSWLKGDPDYAPWIHRFTELLATKRGLASALHSGDPAFSGLPGYFLQRLGPTLAVLLDAAVADGTVRDDISAEDLLHAITQLSQPVPGRGLEHNQRIVAVLVDGLRCGAMRRPPAR